MHSERYLVLIYFTRNATSYGINLDNLDELVKFLFLVHNQNACVHENLLKDMKSESTLQDCLQIAKLPEGTVHVENLGQNFLANIDKYSQNVDAVNRG